MQRVISVLMSTYNETETYLRTAIESILNQTYKDIQFIIVNDNPNNKAHIMICSEYAKTDQRIVLLCNEQNYGLVKSLNRALTQATGDYIARMDADDFSRPDRFEKQVSFLENNKLDLVGSNIRNMSENGELAGNVTICPKTHEQIKCYLKTNSAVPHPTWLGKRTVFELLGGYRDIAACEDYDFLVRLVLAGGRVGNVQEDLVYYRLNSSGISSTKKAIQKTSLYIVRKYYRNGSIVSENNFFDYLNSIEGRKKHCDLEYYYQLTRKLKKISDKKINSFFYMSYIFVASNEGRIAFFNMLKEKLIINHFIFYKVLFS